MNNQFDFRSLLLFALAIICIFSLGLLMDMYSRGWIKFRLYKKKIITRGATNEPYLIRYTFFTCRYFSLKLHKIMLSDHQCLHDHPWAFYTFLIKGGYVEYTEKGSKVYSRFSLLKRPAEYLHRLEIHQPVWSIVLTLRKTRKWGFKTSKGWVEWFKYTPANHCE